MPRLRVLYVSDMHCATKALTRVLRGEGYDLVIASGYFDCIGVVEALVNASSDVYAVTSSVNCFSPMFCQS